MQSPLVSTSSARRTPFLRDERHDGRGAPSQKANAILRHRDVLLMHEHVAPLLALYIDMINHVRLDGEDGTNFDRCLVIRRDRWRLAHPQADSVSHAADFDR